MTRAPATSSPDESPAPAAAAGLSWKEAKFRALIERLDGEAEGLVQVSADARRRVLQAPDDTPAEDYQRRVAAHAEAARGVRLVTSLQFSGLAAMDRLERLAAEDGVRAERARVQAAREREPLKDDRKAQIGNIVERVAERERERDYDEVDRIVGEVAARLLDEDLYGDVLARPISELVAEICRDLGLSPHWDLLAKEAWAREELATGSPGEPLKPRARSDPRSASP